MAGRVRQLEGDSGGGNGSQGPELSRGSIGGRGIPLDSLFTTPRRQSSPVSPTALSIGNNPLASSTPGTPATTTTTTADTTTNTTTTTTASTAALSTIVV